MKGMGLLDGCRDGTAAQDDVAAVDNDCLAGGDGSLRFVKSQQHLVEKNSVNLLTFPN